jgi:hypothetical protein
VGERRAYEDLVSSYLAIANLAARARINQETACAREQAEEEGIVSDRGGQTRDLYTDRGELRGVWTRGPEPQELVLSDGSRLALQPAEEGRILWRRTEARDGGDGALSVDEALDLAGDEFADYVAVRTRAEAEWLRAVADWCREEAGRLEVEMGRGRPPR